MEVGTDFFLSEIWLSLFMSHRSMVVDDFETVGEEATDQLKPRARLIAKAVVTTGVAISNRIDDMVDME